MQFHIDGFQPGDPDVQPAHDVTVNTKTVPDKVDVLIVGCGPAGLTLAAQLAVFPEISTRIVERKPGPLQKGQADGISCRSMEMFQAFGFASKIKREAHWVNETTFWDPNPENSAEIRRSGRIQDVEDGLSEMPHVILNQARVHDRYLEHMRNSPSRLTPNYNIKFMSAAIDSADADYPVKIELETLTGDGMPHVREIRARYVVGCDGARSAVRSSMGKELIGDQANQAWGVMDVLVDTDFPDIRLKCLIKSASEGNIIIIPREGGHLVRIYVEMDALSKDEKVSISDVVVEDLIAATNRILNPHSIDVKHVAWWSIYEVGHRLTDSFDNVSPDAEVDETPRIFIAGDACHTHSAKAGQGMNVSMGDSFNLGWKLVSVLLGRSDPSLLRTYSEERHEVAQDLIDFDHEWSRIIGGPLKSSNDQDKTPEFQKYFIEHGRYTAGLTVVYKPSTITSTPDWQHLARGFEIGARFHSAPVTRVIDAKPIELGETIEADCRWRIFLFADRTAPFDPQSPFERMSEFLAHDKESPLAKLNFSGTHHNSIFDVRAIFQQHHREIDVMTLPEIYRPRIGTLGLRDFEKAFCPDPKRDDIFSLREVDRNEGCIVIVRPDQYISDIMPLDARERISEFFSQFMRANQG